ncbi:MAG TPA: outer membrane beta-barrel protein [Chitinophagales bacterium]|nr:PorT family protein [Chitinophagales bacterium]MCB9074915.1 outer membrane beta-barrel protein [Chitinophagales bacterium]HMU98150.1 outer membrane beta-barrel protein [Chitinophagales bacterium]HMV02685.1 outer membrane beta-barrel protein [Chitinophagales bacterium]HMW94721.1 outer membrane beta-barrel protein [Chitinophagales bacterium]
MKNIFCFVILTFGFFIDGFSDTIVTKKPFYEPKVKMSKMDYGINVGMTLAFPLGVLVEGAKGMPFPGPSIGINTRYYFSNKFSIQAGINYYWNQTRFETPYANFSYVGAIDISMPDGSTVQKFDTVNIYYAVVKDGLFSNKYLGFPIQGNLHINKVWSLNAGAYLAILLKGGMTGMATDVVLGDGSSSDFQVSDDVPFDQGDQFAKFDYGMNFGTNAQLPNGFNFDLKVNMGIASMFKRSFTAPPGIYRNVFFQGTLGYRLGAKERFKPNLPKI